VQDINACPSICMELIADVVKYPGRVPRIEKVEIYDQKKFMNVRVYHSCIIRQNI